MAAHLEHEHWVHRHWQQPFAALFVAVLLVTATGCGWIFNKQHKPMTVEITFIADSLLNFDGNRYQAVQVKVYVLKRCDRFLAADPQAFFDPDYAPGFMSEFGQDTLGSITAIVAPGEETRPLTISIDFIRVRNEKPKLAVIANFARPPLDENRERACIDIKRKTKQKIRIDLNSNWVEVPGKKRK